MKCHCDEKKKKSSISGEAKKAIGEGLCKEQFEFEFEKSLRFLGAGGHILISGILNLSAFGVLQHSSSSSSKAQLLETDFSSKLMVVEELEPFSISSSSNLMLLFLMFFLIFLFFNWVVVFLALLLASPLFEAMELECGSFEKWYLLVRFC